MLAEIRPSLTPEEYCFIYPLLECRSRERQLKMLIAETLVVHQGGIQAWVQTNQDGFVVCRPIAGVTADAIERSFLAGLKRERRASTRWAAQDLVLLERRSTQVRGWNELGFQRLMTRLANTLQLNKTGDGSDLPYCMQAVIPAALQLKFVTCLSLDRGEVTNSECTVGRMDYGQDGFRIEKPTDVPLTEEVKTLLQDNTQAVIDFLLEAHGLRLTMLSCEWVQSESSLNPQKYVLTAILGFKVEDGTLDQQDNISDELQAARSWMTISEQATRVIGKIRRRKSISGPLDKMANPVEFKRRNSLPALTGATVVDVDLPQDLSEELAMVDELELPIWKRMSVPELAKACADLQKRANQLLGTQEDQALVTKQQGVQQKKMEGSIKELEKFLATFEDKLSTFAIKQHETWQSIDKNRKHFREEKERTQEFKTATLHHFEVIETQLADMKELCARQGEALEHTQKQLSEEVEKRTQLQHLHEQLTTEFAVEKLERERLLKIIRANEAAADNRMDSLSQRVFQEGETAAANRVEAEERLKELEVVCGQLGFQKYGGMWEEKKKSWFQSQHRREHSQSLTATPEKDGSSHDHCP